ncbi:hypothetical protein [Streptomyces sp. AD55]|uniref:hypothetical protein n=1 Tax=Streptomyces sp. AD55 TaxID=3242895 RepID=UPI003529B5C6
MADAPRYTVRAELVDMHLDGGLDQQAAEDGASRLCALHARELAAAARASGMASAQETATFLDAYAAVLDGKRDR